MRGWLRCDQRRGFASCWEVSAASDCILKDAVCDGGCGAGWSALGEAAVDDRFGAGIGEEQMLDDLLNAPLILVGGWAELGLDGTQAVKGRGDFALELAEGGVHGKTTLYSLRCCVESCCQERFYLLKFSERFFGGFGLFAFGVKFEIGLIFGDRLILLLHLFCDFCQSEVGRGVVGLNRDRILGSEVGALIIFVPQIKLCDGEVFIDALIVGLHFFDFGKFAMNGSAFRRFAFGGSWIVVGRSTGIVAAGAGAATGVVAGKLWWRLCGEWMFLRGIGGAGGRGWSVGRRRGLSGFAGERKLLGYGRFPRWGGRRGARLGRLIRCLRGCGLVGSWTGRGRRCRRVCGLCEAGDGEEARYLNGSNYGANCHLF